MKKRNKKSLVQILKETAVIIGAVGFSFGSANSSAQNYHKPKAEEPETAFVGECLYDDVIAKTPVTREIRNGEEIPYSDHVIMGYDTDVNGNVLVPKRKYIAVPIDNGSDYKFYPIDKSKLIKL